jgi:general secretion pathway protein I
VITQLGFTLLEVLIALMILAIAFSSSYFVMSETARHLIILQDKTAATWVGMNVIARAQLGVITLPPTNGNTRGQEKMLNKDWLWKLTLLNTPDTHVSQLIVEVSKLSNASSSTVKLIGYINPS